MIPTNCHCVKFVFDQSAYDKASFTLYIDKDVMRKSMWIDRLRSEIRFLGNDNRYKLQDVKVFLVLTNERGEVVGEVEYPLPYSFSDEHMK